MERRGWDVVSVALALVFSACAGTGNTTAGGSGSGSGGSTTGTGGSESTSGGACSTASESCTFEGDCCAGLACLSFTCQTSSLDAGPDAGEDAGPDGGPAIEVQNVAAQTIKSLAFPPTAFGATSKQAFQVASVGTADAHVTLALMGAAAGLYAVAPSAASALTIPAGTTQAFTVTFAPLLPSPIPTGNVSEIATLALTSDATNSPNVTIQISGLAAAQQLDLCWAQSATTSQCLLQGPVTVDFGGAGQQQVEIVNRSDVPLTVSSIALDPAAIAAGFSIVEQVQVPLVLSAATGETLNLDVALTPKQGATLAGSFQVTCDDPRLAGQPDSLSLSGN
jgi:hypothetical protein